MTVTNQDPHAFDDVSRAWERLHRCGTGRPDDETDRHVRDCAARLAADPTADTAYAWTLGLVLLAPSLAQRPESEPATAARTALTSADAALRALPCAHGTHPCRDHEEEQDGDLADRVRTLADPAQWPSYDAPRDEWACPHNIAGYARIALDVVVPGSAGDVPARIPEETLDDIESLSSTLNLYPTGDPDVTLACQVSALAAADDEERPGRLLVAHAISWHLVSGMVRDKEILDDLIEAVEDTLPHYADATCDHEEHRGLDDDGPEYAEAGLRLTCAAGRERYERGHADWDEPPIDQLLCPVRLVEIAQEALATVREGRERLFGERPLDHLDAEYLRADGRLDVEKIVGRLDHKHWNERYADDLGLWAARRHASADVRERVVLFMTAYQTMKISYPGPPPNVAAGVLALMAPLATERPGTCAHTDDHPATRYVDLRHGLPQVYAPEEFPATEHTRTLESWTCPRFTGLLAAGCASGLEKLAED
ncbi:hypothetical protein [Streptomyces sp. ST1015]|uniref:hypothetical protein n=1 Tax=Streptomyces sp. ST1015 TaxID=1848900 RepID=UPI000DDA310F|nr:MULTISPECIES: hypothetical protein [unclassified Streptomyces]QZZ30410.1 hypothetical protein A7X85_32965 [Streptomyces sp. ST1015]